MKPNDKEYSVVSYTLEKSDIRIKGEGSILKGFLIVLFLHILQFVAYYLFGDLFSISMIPLSKLIKMGFGIIQFIYVIPLIILYSKAGKSEVKKGITIAAVLTVIINAAEIVLIFAVGSNLLS